MTGYHAYLRSDGWYFVRERIIERADGYCEACRLAPTAHVHHITYERLGNELDIDLLAVCADCHERIHSRSWPPPLDREGYCNWPMCWWCSELIPPYVLTGECPFCGTRQEDR